MSTKKTLNSLLTRPHIAEILSGVELLRLPQSKITPEAFAALADEFTIERDYAVALTAAAQAEDTDRQYWQEAVQRLNDKMKTFKR